MPSLLPCRPDTYMCRTSPHRAPEVFREDPSAFPNGMGVWLDVRPKCCAELTAALYALCWVALFTFLPKALLRAEVWHGGEAGCEEHGSHVRV